MDRILRIAGFAFIAYLVGNNLFTSVYNRISFGNTRLKLGRVEPTGINVQVIQPIDNRNLIGFHIDTIRATILYGDNPLAEIFLPAPVDIAPQQSTALEFSTFLDFGNVAGSIYNVIDSQQWLQALRVKGYAASQGVIIPFEHTVTVG